jgi:hypothetical protein
MNVFCQKAMMSLATPASGETLFVEKYLNMFHFPIISSFKKIILQALHKFKIVVCCEPGPPRWQQGTTKGRNWAVIQRKGNTARI